MTTRRQFLATSGALALTAVASGEATPPASSPGLGMVIHSFGQRYPSPGSVGDPNRFEDPIRFLEFVHDLGGAGIQLEIGARDGGYCRRLRTRAESLGMWVEGSVELPRGPSDVPRFEDDARTAREAGVSVLRVAMLHGRRYETFRSVGEFRRFVADAERSLKLAVPAVARHAVRLAIENHKDLRVDELVGLLERIGREDVGACVDTGNSIALLDDPMEVVEALAPWALTTHLKDMGVQEYERGFLLSEVPLGEGILDIRRIVATLRKARPGIRLNLEMITRDPLEVPCLSPPYWATLAEVPARDLARTLAMVRAHPPKRPLPRTAGLGVEARRSLETDLVRRCLDYSNANLKPGLRSGLHSEAARKPS